MTEKMKVKELVPYAVIFPYIRMGRSISGFVVNRTKGKFGPFENQIFLGDYTQSIVTRHDRKSKRSLAGGVYILSAKGFPRGFSTFSLPRKATFSRVEPTGVGGTRQKSLCLGENRLDGQDAFEIKQVSITPKGFSIAFTKPLIAVPESIRNITACRPSPILSRRIWRTRSRSDDPGCEERDFVGKWQVGEHRGSRHQARSRL